MDDTIKIANAFGWESIPNEGTGIGDGANTALKNVDCDYFISLEHDVILSQDWWSRVMPIIDQNTKIGAACGIRLLTIKSVAAVEEFSYLRYRMNQDMRNPKKNDLESFLYGKTIDNTVYRTKVIRKIGGFPKVKVGVDTLLAYNLWRAGYDWVVNYDVRSQHIRASLREELSHRYWYGRNFDILEDEMRIPHISLVTQVRRMLTSPVRGAQITFKSKNPQALFVYPAMRVYTLRGIVSARKNKPDYYQKP